MNLPAPPHPKGPYIFQDMIPDTNPSGDKKSSNHPRSFQNFINIMSHTYNSDMPDIKEIQASDEETADFATLCNICCFDEPMTVHEALNSIESHYWQEAMNEEELWCYQGTWVVVDHIPDMHLLTSRWVFKRKRDNAG